MHFSMLRFSWINLNLILVLITSLLMEGKLKIFTSEWIQDHSEEMLEFLNKSEFVSLFTKKLKLLLFVFFIDKVEKGGSGGKSEPRSCFFTEITNFLYLRLVNILPSFWHDSEQRWKKITFHFKKYSYKPKENLVYRNGQDDLRYRIEKKKLKNSKTHW